jgi:hypothetical protein
MPLPLTPRVRKHHREVWALLVEGVLEQGKLRCLVRLMWKMLRSLCQSSVSAE